MTELIDPKVFQRLWRSLTKAGWKAGAPSGLDSEHTYVKPGVKGRLPTGKAGVEYFKGSRALWAFEKQEGLIPFPPSPSWSAIHIRRPPKGKRAAYAAAQKQMSSQSRSSRAVESAMGADTEQGGAVEITMVDDTEQGDAVESTMVVDTEQGGAVDDTMASDTEQADGTVASDIEQDGDVSGTATVPTQQGRGMIANNTTSLDVFDSPHFIDAMRTERLFGPLDVDDVNIAEHYLEPREDVESVRDPVDTPVDLSDSYETEVESDDDFEDDSNEFGQDDTAMRAMAASGREIYDQNHCGDLQIDGADDLYKGTWGAHQVCCSLS
ncbi:hypothetical protein F441_04405 [Phytophthora nicotianae CJ01A1]|uniref:Uncharacterized protein n=1 Tax=Phytophthora nicotianae CJ01A1 TaxID=1317063 RepID=W2XIJ6_PHYNI|nr:hypothetical protein F441_04405 [Phytophthora nicotianae CJ01A1]